MERILEHSSLSMNCSRISRICLFVTLEFNSKKNNNFHTLRLSLKIWTQFMHFVVTIEMISFFSKFHSLSLSLPRLLSLSFIFPIILSTHPKETSIVSVSFSISSEFPFLDSFLLCYSSSLSLSLSFNIFHIFHTAEFFIQKNVFFLLKWIKILISLSLSPMLFIVFSSLFFLPEESLFRDTLGLGNKRNPRKPFSFVVMRGRERGRNMTPWNGIALS